jgi:hypothetical protein
MFIAFFQSGLNILAVKQWSQTLGPQATCGPRTSEKMKILKETLSHFAYFSKQIDF